MARKLTPEQAEELRRCMEGHDGEVGVVYWLKRYAYLKHTTRGKIPWDKPYRPQIKMLEALYRGEDIFVLKSRRVGASWTVCAFVLWKCMFHPDLTALLLSRKEMYAKGLLRRVKFIHKNLPAWMRSRTKGDNKTELIFEFKYGDEIAESNVISLTTTDESGRGEDAAIVFMDEAASIPNADDTWSAVGPTAAFGGQRAVCSTPNGVGGFFHRIIVQLQAGLEDAFTYIESHWKRDCDLSDEWFKKARVGLSSTKILQEFEMVFLSTGRPFFDLVQLEKCYKPPSKFPEIARMMVVTKMNFSGVDTAEGHSVTEGEPDYHSITTLNEMGVQIFAFHDNKMSRNEFCGSVKETDEGLVKVEGIPGKVHRTFPGGLTFEIFGSGDVAASNHTVPDDDISYMVEFRQTNTSKMRLLHSLRQAINDIAIVVTDPFTYQCLRSFENQTMGVVEKAGAAKGAFDDPVISLALAWRELKRYGGYQWDFSVQTTDGRRIVGVQKEEDLKPGDVAQVLPVGTGPLTSLKVPGEHRRDLDEYDAVRRGRSRMRPPGV